MHPAKIFPFAFDPAASEMWEDSKYLFYKSDKSTKSSEEMVKQWADWVRQYPIVPLKRHGRKRLERVEDINAKNWIKDRVSGR